jgi:hypothetical protein
MKTVVLTLLIGCCLLAGPELSAQEAGDDVWLGHVNFLIGYKGMESGWSPSDDQLMLGVDVDVQPPRWPVSLVLQVMVSYADNIPDSTPYWADFTSTFELNLGLRKVFTRNPTFQPFIGGGLSVITAGLTRDLGWWWYDTVEDDTGVGWWAGGGLYVNLNPQLHIGVLAQYSWAKVEIVGRDLNAGGVTCALVVGGRW